MENNSRDFKGIWIPKEIWLNKELKVMEKIFLVEIDSLDNEQGCFASNGYFSDFFGVTKQRCSQIINSLLVKKFITIEYDRQGKEIVKRTVRVVNKFDRVSRKCEEGIKKSLTRYQENVKGSNTVNNTSSNTEDVYSIDVITTTDYLYNRIQLDVKPPTYKNKTPDINKWYSHIDKLNRIDGIEFKDIRCVIDFVVTDDFWKGNVLSASKFRDKFDTLYLQMKKNNSAGNRAVDRILTLENTHG